MNLRSVAVDQAKIYLRQERQQFQSQLEPQLNEQLDRLKALHDHHYEQLELTLQDTPHFVSKRQQ